MNQVYRHKSEVRLMQMSNKGRHKSIMSAKKTLLLFNTLSEGINLLFLNPHLSKSGMKPGYSRLR